MLFGKTSFKISGTLGIIILLLGITIIFGMYQMSKVSSEIVNISQTYEPLQNTLGEIKYHDIRQSESFEKMRLQAQGPSYEEAKEQFWSSNVLMKSSIQQGKKIASAGYNFAPSDSVSQNFERIYADFEQIEQIHSELEEISRDVIGSNSYDGILLRQIAAKESQLQEKVQFAAEQIKMFNDESISAIEGYEQGWLMVQIGIIVVVGIIALFMRHFIGQINSDLKKEIDEKTNELKQANKKLQELDNMKNEFISIASHELKSPIQPIFGFAELARSGDIDQKEAWDGVTTLAKKLQDLANDVLDVTRIESNRLTLYQERLPINEIITEVIGIMRTGLDRNVCIVEELGEDVEVEADRLRIEQVLRNLVGNAIKFTESGTIRIKTSVDRNSESVSVSVSDTGLGIPEEIVPKIFGKFVTKGHDLENKAGNGLGLFLCKGIIEAHGGRIGAKNNKDGGATFEFSLPLIKNAVRPLTN